MKPSMKDKIKGSFHEVKGTIKEEVGKVTNDRNLKARGKARKEGGRGSAADRPCERHCRKAQGKAERAENKIGSWGLIPRRKSQLAPVIYS